MALSTGKSCGGSRNPVTSNLMIGCFTKITNDWNLIFKSKSRNPALLFTFIEVLIIKKCSKVPGSACKVLVHH